MIEESTNRESSGVNLTIEIHWTNPDGATRPMSERQATVIGVLLKTGRSNLTAIRIVRSRGCRLAKRRAANGQVSGDAAHRRGVEGRELAAGVGVDLSAPDPITVGAAREDHAVTDRLLAGANRVAVISVATRADRTVGAKGSDFPEGLASPTSAIDTITGGASTGNTTIGAGADTLAAGPAITIIAAGSGIMPGVTVAAGWGTSRGIRCGAITD
jgi:hypothetical protein